MTIAITGIGTVTSWGIGGGSSLFEQLLAGASPPHRERLRRWGKSADRETPALTGVDAEAVDRQLHGKRLRSLSAETRMLWVAAECALSDAGLVTSRIERDSAGVVVSTSRAGLQDYAEVLQAGLDGRRVNPAQGPQAGINAPASHLSIRLGFAGPNATLSNGAVGGLEAFRWAGEQLRQGSASMMLACGLDTLPPVAGLARPSTGDAPVPRPFDRDRGGALYGEGAVVAILEEERTATARGARTWAVLEPVIAAFAASGDATEASVRVLRQAIEAAETSRVSACFAGANGSVEGDASEAWALAEVLDRSLPVAAVKGGLGELTGASASAQVAIAAASLVHRQLPPTAGYRSADPSLPSLTITTAPAVLESAPVLVHCWDGPCAASVVLRPSGRDRR